ncbi:MAG: hypothetical protein ACYSWQ_21060 [Planctomycetota bacterium]|jgi:hypothetical protein
MNAEKRIEQCLRAAPKPAVPNDLLDELRENVSVSKSEARRSVLHRWVSPTGGPISLWRAAAAAVVAIVVLLPLGYGATKLAEECYMTFKATFAYPEHEDNAESKGDDEGRIGSVYGAGGGFGSADLSEKEATEMAEEMRKLCAEGKAEEVEPGVWVVTLSDGRKIGIGGADPEFIAMSDAERNEALKKQFDEIHELRKAGKYERTFIEEIEVDGARHHLYEDRFTLSNGKVVRVGAGEPVEREDEDKD